MDELTLQKRLNEKFDEYVFFKNSREPYANLKLLGDVYNCALTLDKSKKFQWLERLRKEEQLSDSQIQIVLAGLENTVGVVEHLLSCFEVWIFEELVLLLTERIEVDLVKAVLEEIWHLETNIDLKEIDEKILEISMAKASKTPFKSAVNSIRKYSEMSITNRWLNK